ncbi:MAG TPA: response regulator [Nitrospiraceae bacterium]|nr:response regulator [Nitrospiraceae bacterium]
MMGIRILVADDDPDIVMGLSERLRWLGHEVVVAGDGQAAVTAVESHAIDLVFLDIGMPRLGGIEALKRIRKRWPNLPVVILTAYGTIRLAVEAMKEGAIDFITKPFESTQLDAVVATALERSELKGEVMQLLGEISHDVKNMLMPLVTGTDLLAEEITDLFKALPEMESSRTQQSHHVCEEVIRMLRNSSQRIQDRMKSIADYVAVTSAPQKFESCQIDKIAASVVKSLHVLVKQKQLALRLVGLDTLPAIMADENRLYSALYNLVHNAIPEVPAGGSITIRGSHDRGEQFIALTVQDTGKGMPPEVRDNLFTKRLISRKSGGTGLGTKIVKDAVDSHGGQITVDSQVGKGTTFHIRLPIHQSVPAQKPECSVRAENRAGW